MSTKLENTIDLGFCVSAPRLDKLFENAAMALMDIVVDVRQLMRKDNREISVSAATKEELVEAWLAELRNVIYSGRFLYRDVVAAVIHGEDGTWRAKAFLSGKCLEPHRHHIRTYVKASTLNRLMLDEDGDGWAMEVYLHV